ncbi:MAG: CpXC domain-containing protein [Acidaminococcaceae bacterium]|nr:CpXC domain-containing protein [Acidaminococcaceae bacterium]
MSDVAKQMIICPYCHRTAYFKIWNSINTKTHPETYGQARNLSLFRFCCPYCRQTSTIKYSFLYHQMESALMIYFIPDDEELDSTQKLLEDVSAGTQRNDKTNTGTSAAAEEMLLKKALSNYKYRIVRTHEEFLEKLAIFDSGLDDRIIELAKVILSAEAERQLAESGFRVKDASFRFNRETKERKLVFQDKNDCRTATVSFDRHVANVYNQIVDRYLSILEGSHKKDTIIDRQWASEILKNEKHPQTLSDVSSPL